MKEISFYDEYFEEVKDALDEFVDCCFGENAEKANRLLKLMDDDTLTMKLNDEDVKNLKDLLEKEKEYCECNMESWQDISLEDVISTKKRYDAVVSVLYDLEN